MTGSNGGCVHISCGPSGTTSTCACRISERPFSSRGRWMPTTIGASECSCEKGAPPGCREIASASMAKRSIAKLRSRNARKTKSWIACSSPRSERKRTSSCVKAICSTKPASTEAMTWSRREGSRGMRARSRGAGRHLTRSRAPGQARRPRERLVHARGGSGEREAPRLGGAFGETRPRHALGEIGRADAAAAGGLARRLDAIAAADLAEPRDELELRRGAGKAGLEPAVKRAADIAGAGQLEAGKTDPDRGRRERAAVEGLDLGGLLVAPLPRTRRRREPARDERARDSPPAAFGEPGLRRQSSKARVDRARDGGPGGGGRDRGDDARSRRRGQSRLLFRRNRGQRRRCGRSGGDRRG